MKPVARVIVFCATAVVVYGALVVATLLIGGGDCFSGDCNFVGDAAADDPWIVFAAFLAISAGLGFVATRAVR